MNDCPDLDSIQRKERRLIKIRQLLKEKKREASFLSFKLLNGEGVTSRNGLPVKPKLDMGVRKRAKKKI